jgi:hypothetical protein
MSLILYPDLACSKGKKKEILHVAVIYVTLPIGQQSQCQKKCVRTS